MRPAAFLDRDGTIIEDAHYLADASRVRLLPGAVEAVRSLAAAGVPSVVITNQSGIAQGLISEPQYHLVRQQVERLFREHGAPLVGSFHCPHYPSISGPCDCRKPRTGLHREAARVHSLDLDRSLYVGDRRRDVEPGLELGGFAVLVPSGDTPESEVIWAEGHANVADSLEETVRRFLAWLSTS